MDEGIRNLGPTRALCVTYGMDMVPGDRIVPNREPPTVAVKEAWEMKAAPPPQAGDDPARLEPLARHDNGCKDLQAPNVWSTKHRKLELGVRWK